MNTRHVVLKRPEEFEPDNRPSVSLVLTVKPNDHRARQILDEVGPHVDEITLITVGVSQEITNKLTSHPSFAGIGNHIDVTPESHPHLFFRDGPAVYQVGHSLFGEKYEGPFTGDYVVKDWSQVRNLGWKRCSQEWRLSLDGNDTLYNASFIASVCDVMREYKSELGYSRVARLARGFSGRFLSVGWEGKISRNGSKIRWSGVAKESLEGCFSTAVIDGSLVVGSGPCDFNDIATFKTLYSHARFSDWDIPLCNLLHLARLSALNGLPDFAEAAISKYLENSLYTEERAWACALRGEMHSAQGNHEGAAKWFERSLAEHPGYKSAYRLCIARFHLGDWQGVLDAYQLGNDNSSFLHMVDDGPQGTPECLLFVVVALRNLGRIEEARQRSQELSRLFPDNDKVSRLCDSLK